MTAHHLTAYVADKVYEIPEAWLLGFCRERPGQARRSIEQAVMFWHEQTNLEEYGS